jgi:predicted ArsR family transcriptional regulator
LARLLRQAKNLVFSKIFNFSQKSAENLTVNINGKDFLTVREMAKELGLDPTVVKQRLFVAGIKPLTTAALYDPSALEVVRNSPKRGRPAKGKSD